METRPRLLRITTVPISLKLLLRGQLSFFREQGFEVLAVSDDGPEVASLRQEGITHQVVPMTRKITPFRDLVSLFGLIKVIRRFRPHIVHTHTPKAGLLGMLAAWICRVPVRMHTVAGLPLMETSGMLKKLLILTERITYACATGVYPNSSGLKQYIQQNIKGKSMQMIGRGSSNGIDTSFFKPTPELEAAAQDLRNKHHITDKDIVFSFVGRLVKDKGIGELVKAFKRLTTYSGRSGEGKIFLLLIGPFEQELDPLDAEDYKFLHENPQIVLAGFQSDVRPWIMASDVFVFPSYREGFPNVVMQACCLEVPCIVSDINGCNEIIRHESTGLIVKPKDEEALFTAMLSLINDPGKRKTFSKRAREYVVANFDQKFVWGEMLREYRRLLNGN